MNRPIWPTAWSKGCVHCLRYCWPSRTSSGAERSSARIARRIWTMLDSAGCCSHGYVRLNSRISVHVYPLCRIVRSVQSESQFEYRLYWLKLLVTVVYGAATVGELVYAFMTINTSANVAIIQFVASGIELFSVVRSAPLFFMWTKQRIRMLWCDQMMLVLVYLVEYARLDFLNPGPFIFWIVSSLFYVMYNYSAWLNVAKGVSSQLIKNTVSLNYFGT